MFLSPRFHCWFQHIILMVSLIATPTSGWWTQRSTWLTYSSWGSTSSLNFHLWYFTFLINFSFSIKMFSVGHNRLYGTILRFWHCLHEKIHFDLIILTNISSLGTTYNITMGDDCSSRKSIIEAKIKCYTTVAD